MSTRTIAVAALLALSGLGCTSVQRCGDARLLDHKDVLFVMMDNFTMPYFPIDTPCTNRFEVRNLPFLIYPETLSLDVPNDESMRPPQDAPWRACRLTVAFRTLSGKQFFTNSIDLAHWRSSADAECSGWSSPYQIPETLEAVEASGYDVVVTVVTPSSRKGDRARLGSLLHPWELRGRCGHSPCNVP
jgi:hypothetical protein